MAKYHEMFSGTSIGNMFDMGMTDVQMGDVLGCTQSAVNKWRNGANKAHAMYQSRAKGYMDGMLQAQHKDIFQAPKGTPKEATNEPVKDHIFIVNVPLGNKERFIKMMKLLGLDAVDLDD